MGREERGIRSESRQDRRPGPSPGGVRPFRRRTNCDDKARPLRREDPGGKSAPGNFPAPLSLQLLKKVVPKFRKHERVARAGSDVPKFNSETPKPRNPGTIFPPHVSSRICAAAPRPKSWGQAEIPNSRGQAQIHGVRPFRRSLNCDDKARPLGPDPVNS